MCTIVHRINLSYTDSWLGGSKPPDTINLIQLYSCFFFFCFLVTSIYCLREIVEVLFIPKTSSKYLKPLLYLFSEVWGVNRLIDTKIRKWGTKIVKSVKRYVGFWSLCFQNAKNQEVWCKKSLKIGWGKAGQKSIYKIARWKNGLNYFWLFAFTRSLGTTSMLLYLFL